MKKPLIALSLLLLASLACSTLSVPGGGGGDTPGQDTPPQDSAILFQDDFSNPFSGWDRVSDGGNVTDYGDGVYHMYVAEPQLDIWANPGKNFTDVSVEVDATKVGGPDANLEGLICRYNESGGFKFYMFLIGADGYYIIARVDNGQQTGISSEQMLQSSVIRTGNATNRIRADCIGPNLSMYVNGQLVATATDSTYSGGDVGLLAGTFDAAGADINFDNFVVRQP